MVFVLHHYYCYSTNLPLILFILYYSIYFRATFQQCYNGNMYKTIELILYFLRHKPPSDFFPPQVVPGAASSCLTHTVPVCSSAVTSSLVPSFRRNQSSWHRVTCVDREQACLAGSSVDSLIPASKRTTYVSETISAQDSGLGRVLGGPVK